MKTDRHQQVPTPVRIPAELKAALKAEAETNDRSLNGEIVNRLRSTFKPIDLRPQTTAKESP